MSAQTVIVMVLAALSVLIACATFYWLGRFVGEVRAEREEEAAHRAAKRLAERFRKSIREQIIFEQRRGGLLEIRQPEETPESPRTHAEEARSDDVERDHGTDPDQSPVGS